ncbi:hypothetical protein SS50377_24297 [Spironucleus salmonicida]|uniref:Transmembrane protein n=1 Tax=Spironucleus salmonicida TaxID=348837 RepID=V6LJX2_9EUKA|nr:hypothetical protein SS50377_24297 [Spironucleus salmonicida]|eukprot:EST44837.1 Hypothetical protein SS50377_15283 [Spironucleus salmonicida]
MIAVLTFSCQMRSARVQIKTQSDSIEFYTQPSPILDADETISCRAQTGKTAVYEIQIGTNTFRSEFVVYDAFQDNVVELHPVAGSSAESASTFVIASYMITFLDNNLDQTAAVGQLIVVIYNYNQCIYDPTIQYESFTSISAVVKTNPKCIVKPSASVMYILNLENDIIVQKNITQTDFDFSSFSAESANCKSGTDAFQKLCSNISLQISGDNFISLQLTIIIPKTIKTKNKYTNDYGDDVDEAVTLNFNLIYIIPISKRDVTVTCTLSDQVGFLEGVVYIHQIPTTPICNFDTYDTQTFWVTASELADESGKNFQLQFYTQQAFMIHGYFSCETWEISGYESIEECNLQLFQVKSYPSNMSQAISYKLFIKNVFSGSYRFNSDNIPGGDSNATITQGQMCVKLNKIIPTTRNFISIQLNISQTATQFNENNVQISLINSFEFPSIDNTYCFTIDKQQTLILSKYAFSSYFGVVSAASTLLQLQQLEVLAGYDVFYQGWILILVAIAVCSIFIIIRIFILKRQNVSNTIYKY